MQRLLGELFFKTVQNKRHWATTGHTAAEPYERKGQRREAQLGLTTWRGKNLGKSDVAIAKNSLKRPELEELNRIVTMYLDYTEDQAKKRRTRLYSTKHGIGEKARSKQTSQPMTLIVS